MFVFALAGLASAYNATTTVGSTVFTTYCPSATTFTYGTGTYTAYGETTFTIEDCSCTPSATPSIESSSAPVLANGAAAGKIGAAGMAAAVAYLL